MMWAMADRRRLDGIVPIIAMPFGDDDRIDMADLCREVDFLAGLEIPAFGFGYGSEVLRLTDQERDEVIRVATAHLADRMPLLAGVGAGSVRAVIARAEATALAGADLLMVNAPPGATPDDVRTVMREAAATGRGVIVQDAPSISLANLSVDLIEQLVDEIPGIVALKIETVPSAPKIGVVVERVAGRVSVLAGSGGGDFYHELQRGADGTVPGSGFPEAFIDVWKIHKSGDKRRARQAFNRVLPLIHLSLRSSDTFLWIQKECLRRRGVLRSTALRAPSAPLDPKLPAELDDLLNDLQFDWAMGGPQ
jgi:4-hydroxy-tetrahydrodipicolinate synthase